MLRETEWELTRPGGQAGILVRCHASTVLAERHVAVK